MTEPTSSWEAYQSKKGGTAPTLSPTTTGTEPQAGNAPDAHQPQAGNTTPPEPQAGEGQHSETLSLEEAKKLRSEAQNLRKRLKSYEDAEQQSRDAQLSETERLKKQHADLQAKYDTEVRQMQERVIRYEVQAQAHKIGIIDPDAAVRLLDWSDLEYDEDGTPNNAEKLLKELLKNKPYLKAPEPAQQQAETPNPAQPAAQQRPPAVPAMNPGRTQIASPTQTPPGQKPRIPRFSDPGVFVPPGTASPYQP